MLKFSSPSYDNSITGLGRPTLRQYQGRGHMAVKIIQGLVGSPAREVQQKSVEKSAQTPSAQSIATSSNPAVQNALSRSTAGDAVVTSLKSARPTAQGDKIREYKEAKQLSRDIADKISDTPEKSDPHQGLGNVDAREHFAN